MPPKEITTGFKIAFYIRVSTEEQAENPEGSIRNQEDRLRLAVEYKNRTGNFGEVVGVYTDPGISAKNMKRPQLQELLRAVRNREVNLIMVTELSRLSRNTRDFIQIWDLMRENGCRFTSLREDFDTTNAAGELVLFQLMNLAQFERRQTSERVEANLQTRAARGLYNGGPVLIGYKTDPAKPGYLVVDEEMAEHVRTAFHTFIREGTLSKTAIFLNDAGFRMRKQMQGSSTSRSGIFTVDNLQAMLRNKAYIGVRVFKVKGEVKEVKAVWPPIIDELLFHRAGALLTKNYRTSKPMGEKKKLPYILTGIAHCKKCGNAMSGKSATGNGGKVGYYEHVWATKRDSALSKKIFKCEPHRVPAKKLEPLVWEEFSKMVTDTLFIQKMFEKVKALHSENPQRKDQDRLKAKVMGLQSQLEALAERLSELPKSVSATPIYKQMERLESLLKEHQEQLAKIKESSRSSKDRVASLETFEAFASNYKKFVHQEMNPDQQKQAIQKFIHKVEVGIDTVKVHFIVDEDHYKEEQSLNKVNPGRSAQGTASHSDFFGNFGSNTLTNGARGGT